MAGSICKSGAAQEPAGSRSAGENKKEKQTQKAKVSAFLGSRSDRFDHRNRPHCQRMLRVLIIGIVLIVRGCSGGGTDPLCGKWDLDGTTVYVFDGKGSGALELPQSRYEFRYEIKDGTVSIDFTDDKVRDISYEFTVGSDELTLERKEKNDTIIHKFKKQTNDRSE